MARPGWLLVLLAMASGCALVVRRPTQMLQLHSEPPGAVAALDGERCVTPCELRAPRRRDAVVTLTKEGREQVAVLFRSRLEPLTLVNLLLALPWAAIAIPADVASGAAYGLVPPSAVVPLPPEPASASSVAPVPPAPRALAPLRPVRVGVDLEMGMGVLTWDAALLLQAGLRATWVLREPFVAGGFVDAGLGFGEGGVATASTYAAVGGVGVAPSRNSRLLALLVAGLHRYDYLRSDASEVRLELPAAGVHVQWTAIFDDGFTLGIYARYLQDLDGRGGGTILAGYTLGGLGRARAAAGPAAVSPAWPPPPPARGPP